MQQKQTTFLAILIAIEFNSFDKIFSPNSLFNIDKMATHWYWLDIFSEGELLTSIRPRFFIYRGILVYLRNTGLLYFHNKYIGGDPAFYFDILIPRQTPSQLLLLACRFLKTIRPAAPAKSKYWMNLNSTVIFLKTFENFLAYIYATNKFKLLILPQIFCIILQHQTSNCFKIKT